MEVPETRLRESLSELERYLADHLPPLLVADSVELLLAAPPGFMARECVSWALQQFRAHEAAIPISDLLFHAVKKLHLLGELELVPRSALAASLEEVKRVLIEECPASERELLRHNLERLGSGQTSLTHAVDFLFRQEEAEGEGALRRSVRGLPGGGRAGAEGAALTSEMLRGVRHFTLLLERLQGRLATGPPSAAPSLLSELYASAAEGARDDTELRELLGQLESAGLGKVSPGEMLRTLGASLPEWVVPEGERAPPSAPGEAMQRIVTMADDPREARERFWGLVKSGIEQLNEGSVARSAAILDLAERLIAEQRVPPSEVERVRASAHELIDRERLRELAADPDEHRLLRRVLGFFSRFEPTVVLDELASSEDRQERRLLLSLIELRGASARPAVLAELERAGQDVQRRDAWQVERNLVYLLRRLEPPGGVPEDRELRLVLDLSTLDHELPLVREAIGYLGQFHDERAVVALAERLREVEAMMESGSARVAADDLRKLLTLITTALARSESAIGHQEVVRHGLRRKASLGDTTARLSDLAGVDLSTEAHLIAQLLAALRRFLPVKVLGLSVHWATGDAACVVQALSGTPTTEVRQALADVARRFPGPGIGQLAADVLAGLDRAPAPDRGPATAVAAGGAEEDEEIAVGEPARGMPPPANGARSLEGDLDLFGLPSLLQSLAQAGRTGELEIRDVAGPVVATVALVAGRVADCRRGKLRGTPAFWSLLEDPVSGTFSFLGGGRHVTPGSEADDVVPLILEGMRRHDEYRRARLLVPDEAVLEITDVPPTPPSGEEGSFVREVWLRLKQGTPTIEVEQAMTTDPFRVRSLVAHWVEEGALRIRRPEAAG